MRFVNVYLIKYIFRIGLITLWFVLQAQIPCSENCKCIGCKNVDDMLFATSFTNSFEKNDTQVEFQNLSKNKLTAEINDAVGQSGTSANPR